MSFFAVKNIPQFFVVALAFIGAVFYLHSRSERQTAESGAAMDIPARIVKVKRTSGPLKAQFTGEFMPVTKSDVVSRLSGTVMEVRFKVGDLVIAGTTVATIRASDLDHRLGGLDRTISTAKRELGEREAEMAEAEKHLLASREMLGRDLIARRDVEESEIDAKTRRAQAELARAHLAQQEAMRQQALALQRFTRLPAPINGEVSSVVVKPGARVAEGGAVLSIVSLDTLKLVANVNGAASLRHGMKASIWSSDHFGVVLTGRVVRFESEKNSAGENAAEIHVDNRKRILRPGMAVQGTIDLDAEEDVILIPQSAVFAENKRNYVYKLIEGQATRHHVVLGASKADEIAVAQGLSAGDMVIVDPKMIRPGMRITPVDSASESSLK